MQTSCQFTYDSHYFPLLHFNFRPLLITSTKPCTLCIHLHFLLTPQLVKPVIFIHILLFYTHGFIHNPTLTQLYMPKTDYQFHIPTLDYSKDHLCSRLTKTTNPYDFWFRSNFNFMHLQFNFDKPNKLELLNLPTSNFSFDQTLFWKTTFCTHHTLHTNEKHNFVNDKLSSP